jgi:hypothetical protein
MILIGLRLAATATWPAYEIKGFWWEKVRCRTW